MLRTRKRKVAAAATVLALIAAAAAWAAWTTSGVGPAKAKGGRLAALVVEQPTVDPAGLFPGDTNGRLGFKVTNPNATAVTITAVLPSGAAITSDNPECPASVVEFAPQTGLSLGVLASSSQQYEVGGMSMQANTPDACQGASFTVPIRVNAITS